MLWNRALSGVRRFHGALQNRRHARALLAEAEQITREAYRTGVAAARRSHPSNLRRRAEHPENGL